MSNSTVVFHFEDGTTIGSTICPPDMVELQTNPAAFGQIVIGSEFKGDLSQHYVKGGKLRRLTKSMVAVRGQTDAWKDLRAGRDQLLRVADENTIPLRWASMDAERQVEWMTYRQALLDLPANTTDPLHPIWPTPPA